MDITGIDIYPLVVLESILLTNLHAYFFSQKRRETITDITARMQLLFGESKIQNNSFIEKNARGSKMHWNEIII